MILAGDFVYKLRKPVNFGFLDFSTLELRREDREAEVRLNRRIRGLNAIRRMAALSPRDTLRRN